MHGDPTKAPQHKRTAKINRHIKVFVHGNIEAKRRAIRHLDRMDLSPAEHRYVQIEVHKRSSKHPPVLLGGLHKRPTGSARVGGKNYPTDTMGVPQGAPASGGTFGNLLGSIGHSVVHEALASARGNPFGSKTLEVVQRGHIPNEASLRQDLEKGTGYKEIKHIRQHPVAGGLAIASLLPVGRAGRILEEVRGAEKSALTPEDIIRATEQAEQSAKEAKGLKRVGANRKVEKIRHLRASPAEAHAHYARTVKEANERAFAKQPVPLLREGEVSAETGGELGAKVRAGMKGADKTYQKQKALQKSELRARVGKLTAQQKKATSLTELAHAGGMEGKYSTLPFEGFKGLEPLQQGIKEHIDSLSMSTLDKKKLSQAIVNGINGEVPKPFERKLISRAFGRLASEKLAAAEPESIGHNIVDILNIPRAFKTAGDFSWGLRQGLVALAYKPRLWGKEFKPMFHSAVSEAEATKRMAAIHEDPETAVGVQHGLAITNPNAAELGAREEPFQTQMAEKLHELPFIRNVFGLKHIAKAASTIVRASDRAYVIPLNELRLSLFKHLTKLAADNGRVLDDKLLNDIADIVNTFTGRGNLGKKLAAHRATINGVFFSPGLMKARINMLNPYFYYKLDPLARAEALKAARNLVGTISMILFLADKSGAQVVLDPRSADFGKIKKGNTRLDIGGGFQQYLRLASVLATQKTISSTTGKMSHLGGGFGQESNLDVIQNFFTNKTSPLISEGATIARQNRFGQPLTVQGEVANLFAPLLASDVYGIGKAAGPEAAALYGLPDIFGVGVQNYSPKKSKKKKSNDPFSGGGSTQDPFGGGSSSSDPYG